MTGAEVQIIILNPKSEARRPHRTRQRRDRGACADDGIKGRHQGGNAFKIIAQIEPRLGLYADAVGFFQGRDFIFRPVILQEYPGDRRPAE